MGGVHPAGEAAGHVGGRGPQLPEPVRPGAGFAISCCGRGAPIGRRPGGLEACAVVPAPHGLINAWRAGAEPGRGGIPPPASPPAAARRISGSLFRVC